MPPEGPQNTFILIPPSEEKKEGGKFEPLGDAAKKFFKDHVRIVSSVFGPLKPTDLVPDYKLKMGRLNSVRFWKPILSPVWEGNYIIDLLPPSYRKAIEYEKGITVDFVIIKDDIEIEPGDSGKYIKGRFLRFLCQNKIDDPKFFQNFNENGFHWEWLSLIKRIR